MNENYYSTSPGGALQLGQSNMAVKPVSYKEQIVSNLEYHKEQVKKFERLLELMKENPAILEFMELNR